MDRIRAAAFARAELGERGGLQVNAYGETDGSVCSREGFEPSLATVESSSRRDRYRTWIHLHVTDGAATVTDGWRLPPAVADRVLCDGVVEPVWETDGIPFSVGTAQRIVPDRTRRIVERRDRGCRVPGCTERFVEIHHIIHWRDGGPTDTSNLVHSKADPSVPSAEVPLSRTVRAVDRRAFPSA